MQPFPMIEDASFLDDAPAVRRREIASALSIFSFLRKLKYHKAANQLLT